MAPKSAGIAKLLLFKEILAKRKLFLIIHELSVPAQTAVNGSLMQIREEFWTQRKQPEARWRSVVRVQRISVANPILDGSDA
jgi:hypothetical protein